MLSDNPLRTLARWLTALALTATLTGCGNYALTLNEQVVYMPPSLLRDIDVADERLRVCIEQTIQDQRITEARQLKHLNCSSAGIETLAGLERFNALEELNLASNALAEAPELAKLSRLRILVLRDNPLTDAAPLLSLLRLEQLDVSDNPALPCGDLAQLADVMNGELTLPEQCES
ncbi:leucine-rich repeat domain-containing protein [Marinimicrobium alkaliphilum]|uniref:leucine-rich repeat domain-containing protein n=1 Tax=Marinimicrobium alkaliphilum TaxID=2202654 RepID=UPI001E457703|nr:leucine-rich repeat domain-containing protein [Marinimicrobium alkaliphilum]